MLSVATYSSVGPFLLLLGATVLYFLLVLDMTVLYFLLVLAVFGTFCGWTWQYFALCC